MKRISHVEAIYREQVLPATALELAIDRRAPEKQEKKAWWKLLELTGFQRILMILARGYLFRDGSDGYDRIETARRALPAWCSLSREKKASDQ